MADDLGSLAQAAALIAGLEQQLAMATARSSQLQIDLDAANHELAAIKDKTVDVPQLRARLVELETLLAPPPDRRGIRQGMYYRTTDAAKHKTLPDAVLRQDILDMMAGGESEATATRLIAQGWRRQKDGE
jgi:hypothetical protein